MVSRKPHLGLLPALLARDADRLLQQRRADALMPILQPRRPGPDEALALARLDRLTLLLAAAHAAAAAAAAGPFEPQHQRPDHVFPEFRADEQVLVARFGARQPRPGYGFCFGQVAACHHAHPDEHGHGHAADRADDDTEVAEVAEVLVKPLEYQCVDDNPDGGEYGVEDNCA